MYNLYYVNRDYKNCFSPYKTLILSNIKLILEFFTGDYTLIAMKLSVRGEYALRALLVLALNYDQSVVRIQTISEQQNIPKRFLEQILNDLKSAGVVQSKRGVSGGYRLSRRPEEITLAIVIRHIEGALAPVSCVSERFYEKCSCPDESRCAIRSVMKEVREAVVKIVERLTLADLVDRWRRLQNTPVNPFDFSI
jgi:Rrf2 family protein